MTLAAFTNEPGAHRRKGVGLSHSMDLLTGQQSDDWLVEYFSDEAYRDLPVKSDGKRPTTYHRSVFSCTDYKPATRTYRDYDGKGNLVASRRTWRPPDPFDMPDECSRFNGGLSNAKAAANVRALNGLKANKQQLAVDLLEGRKTFQMLLGAALGLHGALKAVKRGNISGALGALGVNPRDIASGKALADGYLQYRYGWKPMVDSVYGYQEALKSDWAVDSVVKSKGFAPLSHNSFVTYSDGRSRHEQMRGGVKTCYVSRVERSALAQADQLGAWNPLSVGWELIPYSFVVDWFVPVGDVLEAYSATAGLTDVYGYTSEWWDKSVTLRGTSEGYDFGSSRMSVDEQSTVGIAAYEFFRTEHGPKSPEFYGEPRPFGGMKQSRGLAAAALIRQLLR